MKKTALILTLTLLISIALKGLTKMNELLAAHGGKCLAA